MATDSSREFSHKDEESDEAAEMFIPRRRCCFCIPCFGSAPWRRMPLTAESGGGWWARGITALMKIREWSEIAAGPRWKTFIRRFNRSKSSSKHVNFQYDPLSYALNFDDGAAGQNCHFDEEYGFRNFSSRYAAAISAKSSMDLGKDAPNFT